MKVSILLLALAGLTAAQAPPGYVAPAADGDGWPAAFQQAKNFVAKMTLEEKLNITIHGNAVPRLGFPGYTSADGSGGPAGTFSNHSSFVGSITMAASLDRQLMYDRGMYTGQQLKQKGYRALLGPMVNMMRAPEAGRNFESYGPEPYLAGIAVAQMVKGVQDTGTVAVTKHFIGNEQEHGRQLSSSVIDSKTYHEIYEWPFADAVRVGTGAIMCSYNLVNGTYACADPNTLGDDLKGSLDFQGFVVSDFMADRYGEPGFRAGLDSQLGTSLANTPPGSSQAVGFLLGQNLTSYVNSGSLPLSRVNDAAIRIMTPYFLLKQNKTKYPSLPNNIVTDSKAAAAHIRQAGAASTVLLKNNGVLPLKRPKSIALFGIDAGDSPLGPNVVGDGFQVAPNFFVDVGINSGGANNGTLASGWGSAFNNFPYLTSPATALSAKAKADGSSFVYVRDPYTPGPILAAASKADACLAFASSSSGEEIDANSGNIGDRNNITSWHGADELIRSVASRCKNTIVVVHAVGPILMDWADLPNVKAIVFSGLPGQESGNSLVDVLYGAYNPSGKLPFSIAYKSADYPAHVDFSISDFDGKVQETVYTEGVFLDYRHLDAQNIKPRYPFGFGLSYTTFSYSSACVHKSKAKRWTSAKAPGGSSNLYEVVYNVEVNVKNSGKVAGNATPQLYIQFPAGNGEPPKVMRGFEKVMLKAGKSQKITFPLRRKDISIFDVVSQSWKIPSGKIIAHIGESSRDIKASVTLK